MVCAPPEDSETSSRIPAIVSTFPFSPDPSLGVLTGSATYSSFVPLA